MAGDVDILLASENLALICALVTQAGLWNNSSSNIKMPQKKQTDSARQCRTGERLYTTRQFKQQKTTHVHCRQPISEHTGTRWMRPRNAAASHAFSSTQLHKPHNKWNALPLRTARPHQLFNYDWRVYLHGRRTGTPKRLLMRIEFTGELLRRITQRLEVQPKWLTFLINEHIWKNNI